MKDGVVTQKRTNNRDDNFIARRYAFSVGSFTHGNNIYWSYVTSGTLRLKRLINVHLQLLRSKCWSMWYRATIYGFMRLVFK